MQRMFEEPSEGLRIQSELLAVHAVISRGVDLFVEALGRLAKGEPIDLRSLRRLGLWLSAFMRHHHACEDEIFWPMLGDGEPSTAAEFDWLAVQHAVLAGELASLDILLSQLEAVSRLPPEVAAAASVGLAALEGLPAAESMRSTLAAHLAAEEPVVLPLRALMTAQDVRSLRATALATAPRAGLDLLFGIMQDPEPVTGYDLLLGHELAPLRARGPVLLSRYRVLKNSLLG
jgi:hemerythrin-like domain-containing protein